MELLFLAEFQKISPELTENILNSIAGRGIRKLVLSSGVYERDVENPGFLADLLAMVRGAGLEFAAAHGLWSGDNDLNWPDEKGRLSMVESQKHFISVAAELGCRSYTLHPGVAYMRYDRRLLWDKVRKSVEALLGEAEKNQIILALENNVIMNLGIDCAELAEFIDSFDIPYLGACFDTGHAHAVGNVLESFDQLSRHVVTAHLHDNDGSGDQHLMPGQGTIPWDALMKKLAAAPRLLHVESEPSGMHLKERIEKALEIYPGLPEISL